MKSDRKVRKILAMRLTVIAIVAVFTFFAQSYGSCRCSSTSKLIVGHIRSLAGLGATFGADYQVTVTHNPAYNNALVTTGHIFF
jgi:hypothetical protein